MAASPGLRMGVPASMPKTPMFVMEIVPPERSAGAGLARARRVRQFGQRRGELQQGHPVGVLDVRHGQAARGGGRDAQVHVVVLDDLLLRFVPAGVERGVVLQRDQHGLGHQGQRRELVAGERAAGLELRQQLHGRGHVDGQELRDVRCGERAGDHGGGGELAHALDRRPGFPLTLRRSRAARHTGQVPGCDRQVSPADEVADVVPGDEPELPGAGDQREVDAEIFGELAHRRRGPRAFPGFGRRQGLDTPGLRSHRSSHGSGRRKHRGCSTRSATGAAGAAVAARGGEAAGAAGRAAGILQDGAVADEVRFALGGRVCSRLRRFRGRRRNRRRRPRPRRRRSACRPPRRCRAVRAGPRPHRRTAREARRRPWPFRLRR